VISQPSALPPLGAVKIKIAPTISDPPVPEAMLKAARDQVARNKLAGVLSGRYRICQTNMQRVA